VRRPGPLSARAVDVLLVVIGLLSALVEVTFTDSFDDPVVAFAFAAAIIVPMLWRRRATLLVLAISYGFAAAAILAMADAQNFSTRSRATVPPSPACSWRGSWSACWRCRPTR
jgi:hypothetical protein